METAREAYPNLFLWIDLEKWEKCLIGWGVWSRGQLPKLAACRFDRKVNSVSFSDREMMLVDKAVAQMGRQMGRSGLRAMQMYYIADLPVSQLSKELKHGNQVTLRLLDLARRLTYNALIQYIVEDYPDEMELMETQFYIGDVCDYTKAHGVINPVKRRGRKRKL